MGSPDAQALRAGPYGLPTGSSVVVRSWPSSPALTSKKRVPTRTPLNPHGLPRWGHLTADLPTWHPPRQGLAYLRGGPEPSHPAERPGPARVRPTELLL